MKRHFTLAIKHYLLNRIIDETVAERLTPYNYSQRLSNETLEVIGIDVPDKPVTHWEQEISQVFYTRLKISVGLAVQLKMIKAKQIPVSIDKSDFWTSIYVTTKFGLFFRRIPSFFQTIILFIVTSALRLADTANRFKWLAGVISFATLSLKVWHSGLIDKIWIGISAFIGLAVALLLSLWR